MPITYYIQVAKPFEMPLEVPTCTVDKLVIFTHY